MSSVLICFVAENDLHRSQLIFHIKLLQSDLHRSEVFLLFTRENFHLHLFYLNGSYGIGNLRNPATSSLTTTNCCSAQESSRQVLRHGPKVNAKKSAGQII